MLEGLIIGCYYMVICYWWLRGKTFEQLSEKEIVLLNKAMGGKTLELEKITP